MAPSLGQWGCGRRSVGFEPARRFATRFAMPGVLMRLEVPWDSEVVGGRRGLFGIAVGVLAYRTAPFMTRALPGLWAAERGI